MFSDFVNDFPMMQSEDHIDAVGAAPVEYRNHNSQDALIELHLDSACNDND